MSLINYFNHLGLSNLPKDRIKMPTLKICFTESHAGCITLIFERGTGRAGVRAINLGGPKFEITHKSRCLQKSKLVNWEGGAKHVNWVGAGPDNLIVTLTIYL